MSGHGVCPVCGRKWRRPSDSRFVLWSSDPRRSGKRVCEPVCRKYPVKALAGDTE